MVIGDESERVTPHGRLVTRPVRNSGEIIKEV
jgi:hypothetical protein